MAKRVSFETVLLLQIAAGLYLLTLGIAGIAGYSSDWSEAVRSVTRFFGGKNDPTSLIVAIVELVAGIVVLGALFLPTRSRAISLATLVIAALWLLYLVVVAISTASGSDFNFVIWLNSLTADILVLVSLWMVSRRYS